MESAIKLVLQFILITFLFQCFFLIFAFATTVFIAFGKVFNAVNRRIAYKKHQIYLLGWPSQAGNKLKGDLLKMKRPTHCCSCIRKENDNFAGVLRLINGSGSFYAEECGDTKMSVALELMHELERGPNSLQATIHQSQRCHCDSKCPIDFFEKVAQIA